MSKNPAFQFYVNDYFRDTRILTEAARGVWMDVLCILWWTAPGVRKKTLPSDDWSRLLSCDVGVFDDAVSQFERHNICDVIREGNGDVTLLSRRMLRDDEYRENTRDRVAKSRRKKRGNADGNASVTPKLQRSSSSSSSSVTKVTLSEPGAQGGGDVVHSLLVSEGNLSGLTLDQDLKARMAAGVKIDDRRLVGWAEEAARDAALMREVDHPGAFWRKQIEKKLAAGAEDSGVSGGGVKKRTLEEIRLARKYGDMPQEEIDRLEREKDMAVAGGGK